MRVMASLVVMVVTPTDFGFGEPLSGAGLGGADGWLLHLAP